MYHAVALEGPPSEPPALLPSFRSFRRAVKGREGFDAINSIANCPIQLRSIGQEAPILELKGEIGPDIAFWRLRSDTGFESLPRSFDDVYVLSMPLAGHFSRQIQGFAYSTHTGQGSLVASSCLLQTRYAPRSDVVHCLIRTAPLQERFQALTGSSQPAFRYLVDLSGLAMRSLVHTMTRIANNLENGADTLSSQLLHDLIMNQVLAVWPQEDAWHASPEETASRVVARSLDFIEAHLAEPITVSEIARAAAASVRTLQSSFRSQIGQTPIGYILERRLERAHADLEANHGRLHVSQIAYRWGFLHLSDFSRRYRTRYGCLPSETSRRGA